MTEEQFEQLMEELTNIRIAGDALVDELEKFRKAFESIREVPIARDPE